MAPALVVRTGRQPRPKVPPGTAVVAAVPLVGDDQQAGRTRPDGAPAPPWWRRTARPVTPAEAAPERCRRDRQRWRSEDACKRGKPGRGWADVPVRARDAVRTLVARGWVAAGVLDALGVTRDWPAVRLLTRLGGGARRPQRPPGTLVLTRGLRRRRDLVAAQAILADETRQHGELPPRLAALLGQGPAACVMGGCQTIRQRKWHDSARSTGPIE